MNLPGTAILAGFFLGSVAGTLLLTSEDFLPFLLVYSIQFIFYALLAHQIWFEKLSLAEIKAWAWVSIAAFGLVLFSTPILEDDFYRYLWDGHVWSQEINPFLYAPSDSALDQISTDYRNRIGFAHLPTIYPPFAQFIFRLSQALSANSLIALKFVLTIFALGTGAILYSFFKRNNRSSAWALLWLASPLVLKEVTNSAHLDSVAVFFTTATLAVIGLGSKGIKNDLLRSSAAWICLSLAISTKVYPLTLVPLLVKLDWLAGGWRRAVVNTLISAILIGSFYIPFWEAGSQLFFSTKVFANEWIFNASFYRIWEWILITLGGESQQVIQTARNISGGLIIAIIAWRTWILKSPPEIFEHSLWILGGLFLLSPIANAWYLLWVLPSAILCRSIPWLTFSYLVVGSYAWFWSSECAWIFRSIEYGCFAVLMIGVFAKNRYWPQCLSKT